MKESPGKAFFRREKRSEFADLSWSEGLDFGASEGRGALLDGHKPSRSDLRWNRDEGKGNNRQDEHKLSSSTFSLTGDSAHNHAVVYWSGQNSSAGSFPLELFLEDSDDTGAIALSSLCRFIEHWGLVCSVTRSGGRKSAHVESLGDAVSCEACAQDQCTQYLSNYCPFHCWLSVHLRYASPSHACSSCSSSFKLQ
uniref:Uncharacterized protein n=1 Tax=Knipowitschia caucasica TaxID=637954 RepID=A0AAV2LP25_KNICA